MGGVVVVAVTMMLLIMMIITHGAQIRELEGQIAHTSVCVCVTSRLVLVCVGACVHSNDSKFVFFVECLRANCDA